MTPQGEQFLRDNEGKRLMPYRDTNGFMSIGIGRNLQTNGLRDSEVEFMFANDIAVCTADLSTFEFWNDLTEARKDALINMRFNLGPRGFRNFVKMITALQYGD